MSRSHFIVFIVNYQHSLMSLSAIFRHRLGCIAILLLTSLSALADKPKQKVETFGRIEARAEQIFRGDSLVVSYVLYSTAPFSGIAQDAKLKKVKNANFRHLPTGGRLSQNRVREDGKIYYRLVVASYSVVPTGNADVVMPELTYEAIVSFRQSSGSLLEDFFGGGGVIEQIEKIKTPSLKLPVVEKPRRSTREMMEDRSSGSSHII